MLENSTSASLPSARGVGSWLSLAAKLYWVFGLIAFLTAAIAVLSHHNTVRNTELTQAIETASLAALRYEPRHFPHCNLGRIYWAKGLLNRAIGEFERALEIDPESRFAQGALAALRHQLQ